jgi:hypothetical protein
MHSQLPPSHRGQPRAHNSRRSRPEASSHSNQAGIPVKSAAAGLTAILAALIFVVVGIIGWSVGRGAVVASGGTVAVLAQTTSPHRWKRHSGSMTSRSSSRRVSHPRRPHSLTRGQAVRAATGQLVRARLQELYRLGDNRGRGRRPHLACHSRAPRGIRGSCCEPGSKVALRLSRCPVSNGRGDG